MASTSASAATDVHDDDLIVVVTEAARQKLIELRDQEEEGNRLGVRIEVVSDTGPEFTYDLSFQTITKADITDLVRNHGGLRVIIPAKDERYLTGATLDYEDGGLVLRNPNRPRPLVVGDLITEGEVADAVLRVVDTEINPSLAAHGGFVTFLGHDADHVVYMTMGGGCHGCAMSRMTMLQGVQTMIREAVPAVPRVVDLTDHTTGENPFYS